MRSTILLALLLTSCIFEGDSETDIDKVKGYTRFLDIPGTATQFHDNYLSWQSDREFISFRDSRLNIDKFIKANTVNLSEEKFRVYANLNESWWIKDDRLANRKSYYAKGFTFLTVLLRDDPKGSTIWAVESSGN